jgi:two-component system, chemotaxis family, chemotaxis protein CheY
MSMKTLIVEDDFTSRVLLYELLRPFGEPHVAVNGEEALMAYRMSLESDAPYDLMCLDIMMPKMDGQHALKEIRRLEDEGGILVGRGVKVIMTTALEDKDNVLTAFRELCDAYLVKPISKQKLLEQLRAFGLIE